MVQRWRDTGSAKAKASQGKPRQAKASQGKPRQAKASQGKPRQAKASGGSASPLEEHAEWLLAVVAEQSHLTVDEIVAAMRKRRVASLQ
jgi:type VI protein secretion system component VasF